MPITFASPDAVARPIPIYNHVAVIPAGARLLALAGQVGQQNDGEFPPTVEGQFAQALANILTIVASQGGDASSVARLTVFATEPPSDMGALSAAITAAFPDALPAMTFIYVAGLYAPHVKVEIEALAALT